jgi:hypothetical protein
MDRSCPAAHHPTYGKCKVGLICFKAKEYTQNEGTLHLLHWKGIVAPTGHPSQANPRDTGRVHQTQEGLQ